MPIRVHSNSYGLLQSKDFSLTLQVRCFKSIGQRSLHRMIEVTATVVSVVRNNQIFYCMLNIILGSGNTVHVESRGYTSNFSNVVATYYMCKSLLEFLQSVAFLN